MADIRVCAVDGEPLVWAFTRGAEYVCVVCGRAEGVFGARLPATGERQLRHTELLGRFELERAERTGKPYKPRRKIGDEGVTSPVCVTCRATPPVGVAVDGQGKPVAWFARTVGGITTYACKAACIPEGESRQPW